MPDSASSASELPFEEENGGDDGDIEQGGKIVVVIASKNNIIDGDNQLSSAWLGGATSTPTSSATATTTLPLGGLDQIDEEAATAPIVADMAIEEDYTNPSNNTKVAACEAASIIPSQPPAPDDPAMMMEQIEDEDDGLPLPLSHERDSLDHAKKMAVVSLSPPRDEENDQRRDAGSENHHSVSDSNEQDVQESTTAETTVLVAYLVEEDGGSDDGVYHDRVVYEATILEPEVPWWQERRTKVFTAIICALMIAMAASLGVILSRPTSSSVNATPTSTVTVVENTTPPGAVGESAASNRGEWETCTDSTQCENQCCSKKWSDDGLLRCTPVGGFKPKEDCVGRGEGKACTDSIQCENQCCSSEYSDDGLLKCISVGGFKISEGCVGSYFSTPKLAEWQFCSNSNQCENDCCSSKYSDDFRLKCTPVGGFNTMKGCVGRGEGEVCTDSNQCLNQCCSSKHSDDGLLKCTPVGGFKVSEGCVGRGEGETCSISIQCDTQCCSSKYSEDVDGDKLLKCISVGGFKVSEGCVGRGEEDDS